MEKMKAKHICVIIAMCCLCGAGIGICSNTAGIFYSAIAEEMNVGRGAVSVTMTISSFVTAIVSMFVPTLLKKKKRLKPLLTFAVATMAGSTMMMGFSHTLWELYLWNFTRGIGVGIGSFVLATMLINNWIYANHGLVISIVLCFSGMPGALFSSTFSNWISLYGWHNAYFMIAGVIAVFCSISIILPYTLTPEESGLKPYGYELLEKEGQKIITDNSEITVISWKIFALFVVYTCGVSLIAGLMQHLPGVAITKGAETAVGALMLSMANTANIVAKLLYGALSDRIGPIKTSIIAAIISLVGLVVLMLFETKLALLAGAFLFGFTFPNSANSLSLLTGDLFGMQNYNKLYPVISFIGTCGYALGVPFLGVLYDIFGAYTHMFWVCIILQAGMIVLLKVLQITKIKKRNNMLDDKTYNVTRTLEEL